jgi:5'-nucleotidase
LGIRGIALSAPIDDETREFPEIEPWVERVLETLLGHAEPRLVKVNFPPKPRGLRWIAQPMDF